MFSAFSLTWFTYCKREYNPPVLQNNPRLLVVDGTLTNAPDSTYITLTRSRNIADSAPSPVETNATLLVETENATGMPLNEISPGGYGGLLSMDSSQNYSMDIHTSGGVS